MFAMCSHFRISVVELLTDKLAVLFMFVPGMGTEIQANAFFPKNHHMIDLNANGRNGLMSLHHDNQMMRNRQDGDSTMTQAYQNGHSVNDLEKVRQTILMHESVFRNQVRVIVMDNIHSCTVHL